MRPSSMQSRFCLWLHVAAVLVILGAGQLDSSGHPTSGNGLAVGWCLKSDNGMIGHRTWMLSAQYAAPLRLRGGVFTKRIRQKRDWAAVTEKRMLPVRNQTLRSGLGYKIEKHVGRKRKTKRSSTEDNTGFVSGGILGHKKITGIDLLPFNERSKLSSVASASPTVIAARQRMMKETRERSKQLTPAQILEIASGKSIEQLRAEQMEKELRQDPHSKERLRHKFFGPEDWNMTFREAKGETEEWPAAMYPAEQRRAILAQQNQKERANMERFVEKGLATFQDIQALVSNIPPDMLQLAMSNETVDLSRLDPPVSRNLTVALELSRDLYSGHKKTLVDLIQEESDSGSDKVEALQETRDLGLLEDSSDSWAKLEAAAVQPAGTREDDSQEDGSQEPIQGLQEIDNESESSHNDDRGEIDVELPQFGATVKKGQLKRWKAGLPVARKERRPQDLISCPYSKDPVADSLPESSEEETHLRSDFRQKLLAPIAQPERPIRNLQLLQRLNMTEQEFESFRDLQRWETHKTCWGHYPGTSFGFLDDFVNPRFHRSVPFGKLQQKLEEQAEKTPIQKELKYRVPAYLCHSDS